MNKQEAKADAGKLEIDLVPMQIVRDVAEVRMYGNEKYGDPDNWKTVELRRFINALLRHTLAFAEDNRSVDEESGIPHYKHIACNLAFICEILRLEMKFDALVARTSSHLTVEEMDEVIQEYCEQQEDEVDNDDCKGCRIRALCDKVGGNFKVHDWECRMAYEIIKEETNGKHG